MNIKLIAFLTMLLATERAAAQPLPPLAVFQQGAKYGIWRSDNGGEALLPAIYEQILVSDFGFFVVSNGEKWAIFDPAGKQICSFRYDNVQQQLPQILEVRQGEKVGILDERGEILVPPIYDAVTPVGAFTLAPTAGALRASRFLTFDYQGAIVTQAGKFGFLNPQNQRIVPIEYEHLEPVADINPAAGFVRFTGLIAKKKDKFGLLDKAGKQVLAMVYDNIGRLDGKGFGELVKDGKHGLYNEKLQVVLPTDFEKIHVLNRFLYELPTDSSTLIFDFKTQKMLLAATKTQTFSNGFTAVWNGEKWGVLDSFGQEVVPFECDAVQPFGRSVQCKKDNVFFVLTQKNTLKKWEFSQPIIWFDLENSLKTLQIENGKWGYVNAEGSLQIAAIFDKAREFRDGLAMVCKGEQCGFINESGQEVVPLAYQMPFWATETEFFLAKKENKFGYFNHKGEVLIDFLYEEIEYFQLFMNARKNGKYGRIDRYGNVLIPFEYDFLEPHNGQKNEHRIIKNGQLGTLNKDGTLQFSGDWATWADKIYEPLDGVKVAEVGGRHGLLNADGTLKTALIFEKNIRFDAETKTAIVRKNNLWGMINAEGREVIPCRYEMEFRFKDGFACVKENGKFGVVRQDGSLVVPPIYDSYIYSDYEFWTVIKNKKQGILDRTGREVVPAIYETVTAFSEGLAVVQRGEKWGAINTQKAVVIPFEYDLLRSFENGKAIAGKRGYFGMIDTKNDIILPFRYEQIERWEEGFWRVSRAGLFGILSADYKEVVPNDFDKIEILDDFFKVEKNQKFGLFDWKGKSILYPLYDALTIEKGIGIKVFKHKKFGLMDFDGGVLVPLLYDELNFFVGGFARVRAGDKFGIVAANGNLVVPCEYEDMGGRVRGKHIEAKRGGFWGIINMENKKIVPFRYEKIIFVNDKQIEAFKDGEKTVLSF